VLTPPQNVFPRIYFPPDHFSLQTPRPCNSSRFRSRFMANRQNPFPVPIALLFLPSFGYGLFAGPRTISFLLRFSPASASYLSSWTEIFLGSWRRWHYCFLCGSFVLFLPPTAVKPNFVGSLRYVHCLKEWIERLLSLSFLSSEVN